MQAEYGYDDVNQVMYAFGEPPSSLTDTQKLIVEICDEVKSMLLDKNRKYGDSALNPIRIFSKADAIEQINVRIDDKLNRKMNQQSDEDEDVDLDLIGYLVLKRACVRQMKS
jgi:hypothetical protein